MVPGPHPPPLMQPHVAPGPQRHSAEKQEEPLGGDTRGTGCAMRIPAGTRHRGRGAPGGVEASVPAPTAEGRPWHILTSTSPPHWGQSGKHMANPAIVQT